MKATNKSTQTDLSALHGIRILFQYISHVISASSFHTMFIPIHISCYFSLVFFIQSLFQFISNVTSALSIHTFLSSTKWSCGVQFCNKGYKSLNLRNIVLVGPPMLTTNKGFGKGANSSCQVAAAALRAAKSTWCRAPTVSTFPENKIHSSAM